MAASKHREYMLAPGGTMLHAVLSDTAALGWLACLPAVGHMYTKAGIALK
jgi:hypothetical protein